MEISETERHAIKKLSHIYRNDKIKGGLGDVTSDEIYLAVELIEKLQKELVESVKLLIDVKSRLGNVVEPMTWTEDSEIGKKGENVDFHVAGGTRIEIAEKAIVSIDKFLQEKGYS